MKKDNVRLIYCGRKQNRIERIEEENERLLLECGITFRQVKNPRNYIAIDGTLCWYGELNALGVTNKDQEDMKSILRIIDKETALCLIKDDEELVL